MPSWLAALLTRRMLICIFTGFSSGLPLYLLLNLLPAWLRSEGVDLKTIGFFTKNQYPYTWKFLWSPLLDRFAPPLLGRRRGWMLLTQLGLLLTIGALGGQHPQESIWPILWLASLLAFLSATQDIAIDAFRREILSDQELGLGNAVHVNAYRIAGLVPGSLSLVLADRLPWDQVFWITGAFMLPGMLMAWQVKEPAIKGMPRNLREAVTDARPDGPARLEQAAKPSPAPMLGQMNDQIVTARLERTIKRHFRPQLPKRAKLFPLSPDGVHCIDCRMQRQHFRRIGINQRIDLDLRRMRLEHGKHR